MVRVSDGVVEAVGERRCDLLVIEAGLFSCVFGYSPFQLHRRSQELCYGIAIGRSSGVHFSAGDELFGKRHALAG